MKISLRDWWQLQKTSSHNREVDHEEFVDAAKQQLDKYIKKHLFDEYIISEVQTVIDEKQFDLLTKKCNDVGTGSGVMPLMTYHGASSPTVINSILKYGYKLPHNLHPGSGEIMGMTHGNYLGDGVYTSTFFDVSSWYNFLDRHRCIQMIVNMTIVGDAFIIGEEGKANSKFGSSVENDAKHKRVWDEKHKRWFYPWKDSNIHIPIDGVYCDSSNYSANDSGTNDSVQSRKYHTRMTSDLSTIVSGSGDYVIPLFVVTFTPKTDYRICKEYLDWKGLFGTIGGRTSLYELGRLKVVDEDKLPIIKFHRVTRDIFSVSLPVDVTNTKGSHHHNHNHHHHHFVFPTSRYFGNSKRYREELEPLTLITLFQLLLNIDGQNNMLN